MSHVLNLWHRSTVCTGQCSMDLDSFVLCVPTQGALSLSPGPTAMLVVAYGITAGWNKAVFSIFGVLAGGLPSNALYFAISAIGSIPPLPGKKPVRLTSIPGTPPTPANLP